MTTKYRLITRPRTAGSASICTEAFAMVLNETPARPASTSTTMKAGSQPIRLSTIKPAAKPADMAESRVGVTVSRRAASTAPRTEPIAIMEFRAPYRAESPPNTFPA